MRIYVPYGRMVPEWRRIDVDATSTRRIDVDATSLPRHVPIRVLLCRYALGELFGRADLHLVKLPSKTYVFEDNLTGYWWV